MTESSKRLRRMNASLLAGGADYSDVLLDAAAEIEHLTSQLTDSQAEIIEQCRLNGMGAEREARLMAQLTESQARERLIRHTLREGGCSLYAGMVVLKMKTDHSALDALLRAERAKERERCAKVADEYEHMLVAGSCAREIRELEDE